jgi:hypothetical protein
MEFAVVAGAARPQASCAAKAVRRHEATNNGIFSHSDIS